MWNSFSVAMVTKCCKPQTESLLLTYGDVETESHSETEAVFQSQLGNSPGHSQVQAVSLLSWTTKQSLPIKGGLYAMLQ